MSVWEDVELASPHNQSACRPLMGDSDTQGDGRNPKVNRQNVGGLSREKWRPDRIGAPEARGSGGAGGRDCPGRAGEEQRVITWSTWAREPAELPSWYPPSKAPSTLHGSLGAQDRGQGDQERQVGGGPSQIRGAGEERRAFAPPTRAQEGFWAPR